MLKRLLSLHLFVTQCFPDGGSNPTEARLLPASAVSKSNMAVGIERIGFYAGDVDWCKCSRTAGLEDGVCPDSGCHELVPRTTGVTDRAM